MPRLILELGPGARTADVRTAALSRPGVTDASEARQANGVIVSVDEVTPQVKDDLANQPGVKNVWEDLQGLPLIANPEEIQDFLNRARELRGEDGVPVSVVTEPTPGDARTDGGGISVLPASGDPPSPEATDNPIQSATDVVDITNADKFHERGIKGQDIVSVILDTGSCGEAIKDERQMDGVDLTDEGDPWTLLADHGGMATGIMAGDETTPGVDVGFLPESDVFPIKSTLAATELIQAQDAIAELARGTDRMVVVNNSWGFPECSGICRHPITTAVKSTAQIPNVIQVFAAGNEAGACGPECGGSTVGISGPNSLNEVVTVAATGKDGDPPQLHDYSSRGGPGSVSCGSAKPDISAPTFGVVPHGCGEKNVQNGGGTSAAAPAVAGGAGLVAMDTGGVTTQGLRDALKISGTAEKFDGCVGGGNILIGEASEKTPIPRSGVSVSGGTGWVLAAGVVGGLAGAVLRNRLR